MILDPYKTLCERRNRVGHSSGIAETLMQRAEAAGARVVELEAIVKDGVRRAENCMKWQARAEAAEVRVVELAGALEGVMPWMTGECSRTVPDEWVRAAVALSTTPKEQILSLATPESIRRLQRKLYPKAKA